MEPEWDPRDPYFTAQVLLREIPEEFRGIFVTEMYSNHCKCLKECGNGNLENVLTDHIIVSSVGGQYSPLMQPTEPTNLSEKWGIGLAAAHCTLEFTTHRRIHTVLHPSLSRRFQKNDQQLRYRRL